MRTRALDAPQYAFLTEHCPALLWRAGPEGGRDYFNDTWLRFTGRSFEQETGDGWMQGIPSDDLVTCRSTYEQHFQRGMPFEIEFRLRRHDGVYRWMLERGVPIRTSGEPPGFLGSCIDIHSQHESQAARQAFSRMMAHELRTPLQAVQMFMEIMRRDAAAGQVSSAETFERLETQFERFNRLIHDLSQPGPAEDSPLSLSPLNLAELLLRIVGTRSQVLRDAPGRIRHELIFRGPDRAEIRGDRERLEQAFHHVIDNALKFSPRGGTVGVTLQSDGEMHRVAVRDQGVGIPAEDLPRVGQRFFRGSNVPRRNYPGLGLGVALAREIVEKHGGSLSVVSAVGHGTEVAILLPRAEGGP